MKNISELYQCQNPGIIYYNLGKMLPLGKSGQTVQGTSLHYVLHTSLSQNFQGTKQNSKVCGGRNLQLPNHILL